MERETYLGIWTLRGSKVILQTVLFVIFIFYFGLPSVEKYQKKNVMVVNSVKNTNGIPIPAISIRIFENLAEYESCLYKNTSTVESCLDGSAQNWTQIISSVVLGLTRKKTIDLTNVEMQEDFTHVFSPRILTLKLPYTLGPDDSQFEKRVDACHAFCSVVARHQYHCKMCTLLITMPLYPKCPWILHVYLCI